MPQSTGCPIIYVFQFVRGWPAQCTYNPIKLLQKTELKNDVTAVAPPDAETEVENQEDQEFKVRIQEAETC